MAIRFRPLELYQAGFQAARRFSENGIQFIKTGIHSTSWCGDHGPYEHSVVTPADVFEFPVEGDIDGQALRDAMKDVQAKLKQRGTRPRGEYDFHVIFREGTEDRFWVSVADRYMSDSIKG